MRLLQRILIATDLSEAADNALEMGGYLAKAFDSEVILQHVVPPLPHTPELSSSLRKQIDTYLDAIKGRLTERGVSVADPILSEGTPFVKIIECAEEKDANMIVVGSGDKGEEQTYRMGITAERLERQSQRPVLVVKQGAKPQIDCILCPVDFSDTASRALTEAIHLARNLDAKLIVLTVIEPLNSILPGVLSVSDEEVAEHVAWQEKEFEKFLKAEDLHGVSYETVIEHGQPHEEILKAVATYQADLMVIGSVGRTGLGRLFLGSVAEKVVRELPCSIMTVKSQTFIRLQLLGEIEDIRDHVNRAEKLLEKGFAEDALGELRYCLSKDPTYVPAWEGAAAAYERLGNNEEAERCMERSRQIVQELWDRRVEADIRNQHSFWKRKSPYRP